MKKIVVTLTGPSGAGKSTLESKLAQRGFARLVSTTTRAPRPGEQNGISYHFTDKDTFQTRLANGEMVEHVNFNGHFYGLTKSEFDIAFSQEKPVVLVCDPIGLAQIKDFAAKEGWTMVTVFVDNPDEVILERLVSRMILSGSDGRNDHISRLAHFVQVERGWRKLRSTYDIDLTAYDASNGEQVADQIANLVGAMLGQDLLATRKSYIKAA